MQALDELEKGAHQHGISERPDKVAETEGKGEDAEASPSSPDTIEEAEKFEDARPDFEDQVGESYVPAKRKLEPSDYQTNRVSVARAEHEFAELSRQMSSQSQTSRKLSRTVSTVSKHSTVSKPSIVSRKKEVDLEKDSSTSESEGDVFNLEETLRGSKAEDDISGIRSKHIGIIWDNLTVRGVGGVKNIVKVFPQAFVSFFNVVETAMHLFGLGKKGKEVEILRNLRGVVQPGEMVLVLGRPGSGCTTFLKVIANQRFGYTGIDGEVLYGHYDAKTFAKRFRGEAVYNGEDDIHNPTLTVGQTLGFALDVKTPGKRPSGMSKQEFKQKVIDLLLKMFNIEHTLNTIVGNPFMRGISGGERKRVSIAEMMVTAACICAWDNTTRGLDASTALDYAKSLRIMTNIYKTTTFVSLYQASENIYRQFDKVMVIDEGRQVFFGPAKEARAYFEGLGFKEKPRQTTPDYLTGCTDPFERDYAPGRSEANAPHDPESLVTAFAESKFASGLNEEMTQYRETIRSEKQAFQDFETANRQGKQRFAPKSSVYAAPFYLQVWALVQRQFLIKWQDKFSLVVSWMTMIIIAIILGTVWLDLPVTSAGAFTRGGVLFIALLFNAFAAFGELAGVVSRPRGLMRIDTDSILTQCR